jgi:hypothetical protein
LETQRRKKSTLLRKGRLQAKAAKKRRHLSQVDCVAGEGIPYAGA